MRSVRVALVEEAVFTATAGSFRDDAAQGFRDRHRLLLRRVRALATIIRCSSLQEVFELSSFFGTQSIAFG
jgi:hypothetical protein